MREALADIARFVRALIEPNSHKYNSGLADFARDVWRDYYCRIILTLKNSGRLEHVPECFVQLAIKIESYPQYQPMVSSSEPKPMNVVLFNTVSSSSEQYENELYANEYWKLLSQMKELRRLQSSHGVLSQFAARLSYHLTFLGLLERDSINALPEDERQARLSYYDTVFLQLLSTGHHGLALHWEMTFFEYQFQARAIEHWVNQFALIARVAMGRVGCVPVVTFAVSLPLPVYLSRFELGA